MSDRSGAPRILLVEDDEDDYLILREMICARDRAGSAVDWCCDYGTALATIRERRHDVYLIDCRLGGHSGLELVREAFDPCALTPVIMLTGEADDELKLDADPAALGVTDLLPKHALDRAVLERSIRYAARIGEHPEADAFHDDLTGLPNKALFLDRVEQVLQRARREIVAGCTVLFIDLENLRHVAGQADDAAGAQLDDRLVIALSGRLQALLGPGDTAARIGGDQFALLLDGTVDRPSAATVAKRVLSSLAEPFSVEGHQVRPSTSIGIALSSPPMSAVELLRNADVAMHEAKRGGFGFAVFDQTMHRRAVERFERENELRAAVERALMPIHYQPIVDLATGAICGFEALVRWPAGWAEVAPRDFIPIAEETGLIGALGLHVLRTALGALAEWRGRGLVGDEVYMSVNVSRRQLEETLLPSQVRAAIERAGLPPAALRLEITESTLMHEPEAIERIVSGVCAAGVGLHLDDFGTGYSSVAALHRFRIDTLKIDRSFVSGLERTDSESDVIVRSTIALAHSLGLHVIAEGVENVAQLERLRTLGCEYGQGFLFARPLDVDQIRALLGTWRLSYV